jgi:hypothetical protein
MKLDLSKYSGYYFQYKDNIFGVYDVVCLVRPEWYIPNKNIKFKRVSRQTVIGDSRVQTSYTSSTHFTHMVE